MYISSETWLKIHSCAMDSLGNNFWKNCTSYSYFNFDLPNEKISIDFDLIKKSRDNVIPINQLIFNKQVCLHLKNNSVGLFFLDNKIRDELFYGYDKYGHNFYYILNDLHDICPIHSNNEMIFYLDWYNSRFVAGWGNISTKNDPYFENINMDLYKTNLEYIDYLKLIKEEKFILEKISNLKMDIIY